MLPTPPAIISNNVYGGGGGVGSGIVTVITALAEFPYGSDAVALSPLTPVGYFFHRQIVWCNDRKMDGIV